MIRSRLMNIWFICDISTVLIPLASDSMHEFYDSEWNVHIYSCWFFSLSLWKSLPLTKSKYSMPCPQHSLFVTGLANLLGGQQNSKHDETYREKERERAVELIDVDDD